MKLALECPTRLLPKVQPLADFDFILSHLVLQDKEYAKFYKESTRYKILDSSVNELLQPLGLSSIQEADSLVGPCDLIVAPDFLGNAGATLDYLEMALEEIPKSRILPVVQGSTPDVVLACARSIWALGFKKMAIPYDICCERSEPVNKMGLSRHSIVSKLENEFDLDLELHLLGMTTLEELKFYSQSRVVSIDTGGPVLMGLNSKLYGRDTIPNKSVPTMNQMPEPSLASDTFLRTREYILYNIAYLRKVLNGA